MTDAKRRLQACAKRWANRLPRERSENSKLKAYNLMLRALLSTLPPKTDGTHPLDHKHFELEG
jgi:hypothetical protein